MGHARIEREWRFCWAPSEDCDDCLHITFSEWGKSYPLSGDEHAADIVWKLGDGSAPKSIELSREDMESLAEFVAKVARVIKDIDAGEYDLPDIMAYLT